MGVDVSIAHSRQSGEGSVDWSQVQSANVVVDHSKAKDPCVGLEVVDLGSEVPDAADYVHNHNCDASETEETHKLVIELQDVWELLESLVVLEYFEYFEESSDPEKPVKSGKSGESDERVVIVILSCASVEPVLNQVGWDAGQDI